MGIDSRECFNLMRRNPDGSEDVDVKVLRDIVLASRESGNSVWIHNQRIYPEDLSGTSSTDGPEKTSMGNHGAEHNYKSKQGD